MAQTMAGEQVNGQQQCSSDGHGLTDKSPAKKPFATANHEQSRLVERRQGNNKTTDEQTMMHILKSNIGTGVLTMPSAFKNVGLWLAVALVPVIGAICIHCINILIASLQQLSERYKQDELDYEEVAALSLASGPKCMRRYAKLAQTVIKVFLIFTQLGICCIYVMFVEENIRMTANDLFGFEGSKLTTLLIIYPVIGLTSCIGNLKHMARITTTANVLLLTALMLILFDLLQFDTIPDQKHPTPVPIVLGAKSEHIMTGLPIFFVTVVYAFEGISVVLPIVKQMKHPERISGSNGVLNTAMLIMMALYIAIGFYGYAKYGEYVDASITLNLPRTKLNESVRFMIAVAVGLSYSLQFYVLWAIMWPYVDEKFFFAYKPRDPHQKLDFLNRMSAENDWTIDESQYTEPSGQQPAHALTDVHSLESFHPSGSLKWKRRLVRYILVFLTVAITFAAAASIPRLDLFISLIGSLSTSCLAIIFPPIIQICTFWELERTNLSRTLLICKNMLLIVFGSCGMILGGWISMDHLIEAYHTDNH